MRVSDVAALVVTFQPDARVEELMRVTAAQVGELLVVDNGSRQDRRAALLEAAAQVGAAVVQNETNRGIASALNQGCEALAARGYQWILLLDQDTLPSPDMVPSLLWARNACPAPDRVAIVGSATPFSASRRRCRGRVWLEMREVITSGSLLDVGAMRAAGPFRDDFFIDYVDIEYCLRLRRLGYVVIATCSVTMQHAVGDPAPRRFLFWTVTPTRHNAARRYYITRNRLQVWRRYGTSEPAFLATDGLKFCKELLKLLLYEDGRREKLASIWWGVHDAIRGRMGARAGIR